MKFSLVLPTFMSTTMRKPVSFSLIEHEKGLSSFLVEPQKSRVKRLFEMSNRRGSVIDMMDHRVHFDPVYVRDLSGVADNPLSALNVLQAHGEFLSGYVMSTVKKIDGYYGQPSTCLDYVYESFGGSYVSFLPGLLSFFRYEDGRSIILIKKP